MNLYTHDQHQLCVMHPRSGWLALAPRLDVECAREDEFRTEICTSFLEIHETTRNLRDPEAFPRGEHLITPSPEAARWRDAVIATLDRYAALPFGDRYFTNIQYLWLDPARLETK